MNTTVNFGCQLLAHTRGATGKKTVNAGTMFNNLFDVQEVDAVEEESLDEAKLDKLEMEEV